MTSEIEDPNVVICFDRYFTSVNLLTQISFAAVGTCVSNRKNLPVMDTKLQHKGDYEFFCSNAGLLVSKWKDTKEVLVHSNCHYPTATTISRKQKDGRKVEVTCSESISFYNDHMGGVNLSDQLVGIYDVDRKSAKWWEKVFYKLLLTTVVNA